MNLFKKRQYVAINSTTQQIYDNNTPVIPDGMWFKCLNCGKMVYKKEMGDYKICPQCETPFRLTAWERINMIVDNDSFIEMDSKMFSKNPLDYPGYDKKIESLQKSTHLYDAVITGVCNIYGKKSVICVMDSNFIMGSMGSVVGEKITRAFEFSIEKQLPIIVFTTSGGARMQEGIISLMQMAKVSAIVKKHSDAGILYITVITDPTTGGVTASFAMLGDIIISEPKAMIGFAGRRVIEQTINQDMPEGFQTAEFLLEHGFIDKIVPRNKLKGVLHKILKIHDRCG